MAGLRSGKLRGVPQGHGWENDSFLCFAVHKIPSLDTLNPFFSTELPDDVIKMAKDVKPITEIKQTGNDFVITSKTPGKSVTNSFTIGKEAEITTMDGKKLKVI